MDSKQGLDIDRHVVKAMKDKEKFINNVLLSMNESSAELSELEKQYKAKSAAVTNAEQFTESLAQYAGMKKLTVYYKFVGQID